MDKTKVKKIAFFTVGFAYNRLVRMKFYEKVFPKDVEIYLLTTDKYKTRKSSIPQEEYKLDRTKVVTLDYNENIILQIRRFCVENKIDRLINLGFHTSAPFLWAATVFTKTDFCINVLTDIFKQHYLANTFYEKTRDFFTLPLLFLMARLAKKLYFTDPLNAARAPKFFLTGKEKLIFLAAPVNTKLFTLNNKASARKKLGFKEKDKIMLYVGRANYLRCSDILQKLINEKKDWKFIVVGPLVEGIKSNQKNLINIEKLSQEELVDYYNASDFVFCLNRGGGGIGLSSEEALACGKPIVISKQFKAKESEGLYQIDIDYAQAKKSIEHYLALSEKEKTKISKKLEAYAQENYSYDIWKGKYIDAYLS